MQLETALKLSTEIIDKYHSGMYLSEEKLRKLLRYLSACRYYLTKDNVEAFNRHNEMLYNFDGSVARGQIIADHDVPELRMTRKIIEAIDQVLWSMRSELSIIKNDREG
jgi:hypothetical protein